MTFLKGVPSLLHVSWHLLADTTNGASITAREYATALVRQGWNVSTFSGPAVDGVQPASLENTLRQQGFVVRKNIDRPDFSILSYNDSGIHTVVFSPNEGVSRPSFFSGNLFLELYERTLLKLRPDIVTTYGGYEYGSEILSLARSCGAKTVVYLQNFAYNEADYFKRSDLTIVPSQYSADFYRKRLGINTSVVPPLIDPRYVVPEVLDREERRYVLFVNPSRNKGVACFIAIVRAMAKRRPDIKFLVVEGSSRVNDLKGLAPEIETLNNVFWMHNCSFPSAFYRLAKVAIVPSLFEESFCRVAVESMMAGIPTIVSDRGALPETVGDGGLVLSIPSQYQPETTSIPSERDVIQWLESIEHICDDETFREQICARGFLQAERYRYSTIVNRLKERLYNLYNN